LAGKGERALVSALRRDVRRQANPGRAEQQQAYMKSAMPYAGLTAGQLRAVCKNVFATHPLNDAQAWRHRRTIRPKLMRWASRDDLWLRRTAILAQIKFKARTDTDLLHHAIQGSIFDGDFFARKAIGWALREFAKTNPQWVVDYVRDHAHRLSSLSQREALRILRKQGVVAP
jgi:hypothetical protein